MTGTCSGWAGDVKGLAQLGQQTGMGVMLLVKEQPVQRPGVQKACDYLKEWKTPHTFTPAVIHPSTPFALGQALCWAQGHQGEAGLTLPKGLIAKAGRQTIIMRAEIYTDALGRSERWTGKASWRAISLRFDLRRS